MRKILLFCVCASLLCGCSDNKQNEQQKQAVADSIAKAEQHKKEMEERTRADSLAVIAWGDLRFGMSKDEALQTVSLRNGDIKDNMISMHYETRFALGKTFGLKELHDFEVSFRENELFFVDIFSSKVTASHIDDLVSDCKIFVKNFTTRMGEPLRLNDKEINIFSFNEGEKFIYAQFNVGAKCVIIQLGETYSGSEYFYEVSINNWQYPKKTHVPTSEEKAQWQKEDEERQRIIDNSF